MDVNVALKEIVDAMEKIKDVAEICPDVLNLGLVSGFDYSTLITIKGRIDRKYNKSIGKTEKVPFTR